MGAFCVFGVSRSVCRKLAEKSVPTFDKWTRRELTAPEWGALVKAEGDRLFAESMKEGRISPELDTPQFCRDWIAAQPGEVKLTRLMCRGGEDRQARRRGDPQGRAGDGLAAVRRNRCMAPPVRRGFDRRLARA